MSLIVCRPEGLYADRRISLKSASDFQLWSNGVKLFINPEGTVAFGVAGQLNLSKDLVTVMDLLASYITLWGTQRYEEAKTLRLQFDRFRNSMEEVDIYAISLTQTFFYDGSMGFVTHSENDWTYTMGTGKYVYEMCEKNGLPIKECFRITHESVETVGPVVDFILREDLRAIRPPTPPKPLLKCKGKARKKKVLHA